MRTEVAVYADGGAARALDAVRTLAPHCSQPVPPGSVELPSVLALHVALVRTAADPEPREVVVLRSGDALAVLEVDGAGPARTNELARLVAARLVAARLDREQPAPSPVSSPGDAGDAHRRAARQLVLTGAGRRVTGQVASYEDGEAAAVLGRWGPPSPPATCSACSPSTRWRAATTPWCGRPRRFSARVSTGR
jgi:hypothetical protein